MSGHPKKTWHRFFRFGMRRAIVVAVLLSAGIGSITIGIRSDPDQGLWHSQNWVLLASGIGAIFRHPFWGAAIGLALFFVCFLLAILGVATGFIPLAG